MLMPYNGLQTRDDSGKPIYIYVQLLFPRYNKNGTFMSQVNYMDQYFFPEWDRRYFSKETQCFIKTVGQMDMVGGCASASSPYNSVCLGPNTATNYASTDEKATKSTYGILYQVNSTYALFQDLFSNGAPATLQPPLPSPEVFYLNGAFNDVQSASASCRNVGASVASREDVYDAYAAGLNVCQKGFVADGYVASSSLGTLGTCPNNAGFRINSSDQVSSNKGAFCYGVRPQNNSNVVPWSGQSFNSRQSWFNVPRNVPNKKCGAFSDDKYFAQYPSAKASGLSALKHWVNQGMGRGYKGFLKGTDFSGSFDQDAYTQLYAGQIVNQTGLQHLQQKGVNEDRWVCLK